MSLLQCMPFDMCYPNVPLRLACDLLLLVAKLLKNDRSMLVVISSEPI